MSALRATLVVLAACTMGCGAPLQLGDSAPPARPAVCGVDASFLPVVLAHGGSFRDRADPIPPLEIYRRYGIDTIRLRLRVDPEPGVDDLPRVIELSRQAQELGLSVFLDLFYSDTWADPGHQTKPRTWARLSGRALEEMVESYTRDVMAAMKSAGVTPAFVQIGNEITSGFLWPDGQLKHSTPEEWSRLARLLDGATGAVRSVFPRSGSASDPRAGASLSPLESGPRGTQIILHLHAGGDGPTCQRFLAEAVVHRVDFDVIGLSYYPWWHGSLAALEQNMGDLAERFRKPILICETAYPWTLGWRDDTHNVVGLPEQLLSGFGATPAGQLQFIQALRGVVNRVPRNLGLGFVYWAPDWLSAPDAGSAWENLTLFDFDGDTLPALEALAAPAR